MSGRFAGERRMTRAGNYRPWPYWGGTLVWIVYFSAPLAPGWLISQIFDELQGSGATARLWVLLAVLGIVEAIIVWGIAAGHRQYMRGLESSKALLRANALDAQLDSDSGRSSRSIPVGDVLVRLRDDPMDMLMLMDNWVDLVGALIYSSVAAWFLWQIDPWAAVAGVGPMVAFGVANRFVSHIARRFRAEARAASSEVSDFLSAAFEASLTVKVTGAQDDVLERLDGLNAQRSRTAVSDDVWNQLVWTINGTVADVVVGMALLVAAAGPLTAGDVTLFFAYLAAMTWLPMRLGGLVAGRRRYDVSAERMDALIPTDGQDTGTDPLIVHRVMPILGGQPASRPHRPQREPLQRLALVGVSMPSRGIAAIDLTVERGQLVVVSGPVGAGKTSLLRGVLGLLPFEDGEIRWNERVITDVGSFMVPPQCAYVAQAPRLFAETLADNLRLGHDLSEDDLLRAIDLAAFDDDVAALPAGLSTMVGARGVRLSGGQLQRAAGARALAQRPELLVLDDLTSALDVDTERILWDRLASAGMTVLAASNRPVALERADHVLRL